MHRSTTIHSAIAAILLTIVAGHAPARAENWPQWRGPQGTGISTEKNLPKKWSKTENVAWTLEMPGPGMATPIVWEDRVFVTSVASGELLLLCVSTDGKELWRRKVAKGDREVRGDEGNMATPTPVTDGKHVWVFMAEGTLACYDFKGNKAWSKYLPETYGKDGKFDIAFGMSSTPVLDDGKLYLQLMYTGGQYVVALDARTGSEVFKVTRPSDGYAECEHSYASPVLYRDETRRFLLVHGNDYVSAHDPTDGRELFRCGGMNPRDSYNPTLRFVASPTFGEGIIVVPSAKNGPVLALRPDATGDVTHSKQYRPWTLSRRTPDVPSPLIHDGLVYLCREDGFLLCLDLKTGEVVYDKPTTRGRHRSSPVLADGHLYLTSRDDGIVTVVKAGRDLKIVSMNEMEDAIAASPAISNGRIYIRSFKSLWAIR
jgi:outer membrane protein assembly factor BamB